jgi:flagellar biosynthesis/type III secretory pathway protein FliH
VSVHPAAPFLVDFDAKDLEIVEEAPRDVATVNPELHWGHRIEEAYARGIEDGRKATEGEAVTRLEELKAEMEQGLAAAREAWCAEEAPRIAGQITTAIGDMEDRVAQSAERVLRPFLAQAVRVQAIGELRALLQELLLTNPGITLEISGPEDLLAAARASLSASVTVSYVANEARDVQVKAAASIIETRIAAWLQDSAGQMA